MQYLPVVSTVLVAVFAARVFGRWLERPSRWHQLFWGVGLVFYGLGSLTESLHALFGWSETWGEANFKVWYIAGAVLVAAWLGQGTVFLLWRRIAVPTLAVLLVASAYAVFAVASAPFEPGPLIDAAQLSAKDVLPMGVRLLTPFFNIYGLITLVGGALWSAFYYLRRRTHANRMAGNVAIAAGALMPAIGGTLNRFGFQGLYLGELVGAFLMFYGFLLASRHAAVAAADSSPAHASSASS